MIVTIGGTTFDRVLYDDDADVLYLHVGDPVSAVDFDESPVGHALRFDATGRMVGMTIVGARRLVDAGAPIAITVPRRLTIDAGALALVITSAA